MTDALMPAVFIGHGSPMNALEDNRFTRAWATFGRTVAPAAIVAISAHWYTRGTGVTAMAKPKTIHDFNGFPKQLSTFQYPAPGSPELATKVVELVGAGTGTKVALDQQWGLDHGTWSVLAKMFPKANVPVVQLSIEAGMTTAQRLAVGAALAPLRAERVLVLASGNVVHNLREIQWNAPNSAAPWNTEFELAAKQLMTKRPADIGELASHRQYRRAAPSPDHLVPLDYIAGIAVAAGTVATTLVEGPAMGSLSMTSYVVR